MYNKLKEEYDILVNDIKQKSKELIPKAIEGGLNISNSKVIALKARKCSLSLTNKLKEFRKLSIRLDKEK